MSLSRMGKAIRLPVTNPAENMSKIRRIGYNLATQKFSGELGEMLWPPDHTVAARPPIFHENVSYGVVTSPHGSLDKMHSTRVEHPELGGRPTTSTGRPATK